MVTIGELTWMGEGGVICCADAEVSATAMEIRTAIAKKTSVRVILNSSRFLELVLARRAKSALNGPCEFNHKLRPKSLPNERRCLHCSPLLRPRQSVVF
jgi:hypothetical protein